MRTMENCAVTRRPRDKICHYKSLQTAAVYATVYESRLLHLHRGRILGHYRDKNIKFFIVFLLAIHSHLH